MRLIDADALIKAIDGNPFITDSIKSYIRVSVAKMPSAQPDVPDTNVGDMISRRAAIDACHNWDDGKDAYAYGYMVEERLQKLPSAQPEKRTENTRKTHGVFLDVIDRQAAINALINLWADTPFGNPALTEIKECVERVPSVAPEWNHDEWCTDCKEYDKERHCCPRFNRVIRAAMADANRWVPCSERLPEDSGRYLISVFDGVGRRTTVAPYQPRYKAWTMTGRMAYWKVIAWMPLPDQYEPEE